MSWIGFTEKREGNSSVDLSESPRDFTHILVNLSDGGAPVAEDGIVNLVKLNTKSSAKAQEAIGKNCDQSVTKTDKNVTSM